MVSQRACNKWKLLASLDKNLGMALVKSDYEYGDSGLEVAVRKRRLKARLVKLPFIPNNIKMIRWRLLSMEVREDLKYSRIMNG